MDVEGSSPHAVTCSSEIRTKHLQNTNLESYRYDNALSQIISVLLIARIISCNCQSTRISTIPLHTYDIRLELSQPSSLLLRSLHDTCCHFPHAWLCFSQPLVWPKVDWMIRNTSRMSLFFLTYNLFAARWKSYYWCMVENVYDMVPN
jgi:hypothetical protein